MRLLDRIAVLNIVCALLISCGKSENSPPIVTDRAKDGVVLSRAEGSLPAVSQNAADPLKLFLERHTDMHLLSLEEVRRRLGFAAEGGRNVTAKGDTNGDGYSDVVAIFVRQVAVGRNSSVAVFHGGPGGFASDPIWVVQDSEDSIAAVSVGDRRVILTVCDACDDVPIYYWSGDSYELRIRLPGAGVCAVSGARVYSAPSHSAPVVFRVAHGFGYAEILELGTRTENGTWWHRVRLTSSDGKPLEPEVSGFIDSADFFLDIGC